MKIKQKRSVPWVEKRFNFVCDTCRLSVPDADLARAHALCPKCKKGKLRFEGVGS